jgi:hypothetical protein
VELDGIGKLLVVVGLAVAALGALLIVGGGLGLGRLPGDLDFRRGNTRVFVPLATGLLLSVVATVLINLFTRR